MSDTNKELSLTENNVLLNQSANLSNEIISKLDNLTLITPDDVKSLKEAQSFLLSTYTDVTQFRPMVVKLCSVLTNGNFPTPDSKYWQCKSEAEVHYNELVRAYNKYERALVDIEEIDYKIKSINVAIDKGLIKKEEQFDPELAKFDLKRLEIKRKEYVFELKQLEKTIKYRIEEVSDWHKISESLKGKLQYSPTLFKEHLPEAKFKQLEYKVAEAKTEEEKAIALDQLNTFKELLVKASQKKN